jgi:hypothetical protein
VLALKTRGLLRGEWRGDDKDVLKEGVRYLGSVWWFNQRSPATAAPFHEARKEDRRMLRHRPFSDSMAQLTMGAGNMGVSHLLHIAL